MIQPMNLDQPGYNPGPPGGFMPPPAGGQGGYGGGYGGPGNVPQPDYQQPMQP